MGYFGIKPSFFLWLIHFGGFMLLVWHLSETSRWTRPWQFFKWHLQVTISTCPLPSATESAIVVNYPTTSTHQHKMGIQSNLTITKTPPVTGDSCRSSTGPYKHLGTRSTAVRAWLKTSCSAWRLATPSSETWEKVWWFGSTVPIMTVLSYSNQIYAGCKNISLFIGMPKISKDQRNITRKILKV